MKVYAVFIDEEAEAHEVRLFTTFAKAVKGARAFMQKYMDDRDMEGDLENFWAVETYTPTTFFATDEDQISIEVRELEVQ